MSAIAPTAELKTVADAIARFDDWLDEHRGDTDAWPAFDEFIRHILFTSCGATHARPFRILSEGAGLVPLRSMESSDEQSVGMELGSARHGIVGHVAMTGRSFHVDDASQGELIQKLAERSPATGPHGGPVWCFAIRRGARTIGVVSVGQFGAQRPSGAVMRAFEGLIGQFWTTLSEVCRSRSATTRDPVSGFMTRDAFLDEGRRVAEAAFAVGEPVAVAVIQVEGLRSLLDRGRWDLADEVLQEVSTALRRRLRPDDLIGRFDDARVVLLLRRVDSELASLIADQFVERLASLPVIQRVVEGDIEMRCGVAGSGTARVPIGRLTSEALRLCGVARERRVRTVTDVFEEGTEGRRHEGTKAGGGARA
ncbi:MAG: diguanylate cyclase [Phycisphaerales bacterium]|nr:diguanylate cyclase [Phycisphaerales bacterium]